MGGLNNNPQILSRAMTEPQNFSSVSKVAATSNAATAGNGIARPNTLAIDATLPSNPENREIRQTREGMHPTARRLYDDWKNGRTDFVTVARAHNLRTKIRQFRNPDHRAYNDDPEFQVDDDWYEDLILSCDLDCCSSQGHVDAINYLHFSHGITKSRVDRNRALRLRHLPPELWEMIMPEILPESSVPDALSGSMSMPIVRDDMWVYAVSLYARWAKLSGRELDITIVTDLIYENEGKGYNKRILENDVGWDCECPCHEVLGLGPLMDLEGHVIAAFKHEVDGNFVPVMIKKKTDTVHPLLKKLIFDPDYRAIVAEMDIMSLMKLHPPGNGRLLDRTVEYLDGNCSAEEWEQAWRDTFAWQKNGFFTVFADIHDLASLANAIRKIPDWIKEQMGKMSEGFQEFMDFCGQNKMKIASITIAVACVVGLMLCFKNDNMTMAAALTLILGLAIGSEFDMYLQFAKRCYTFITSFTKPREKIVKQYRGETAAFAAAADDDDDEVDLPRGNPFQDSDDEEYGAQAGGLHTILSGLGNIFNIASFRNLGIITTVYVAIKSAGSAIAFLLSLIPYTAQAYLMEKWPTVADVLVYHTSPWYSLSSRIKDMTARLKDDISEVTITAAKELQQEAEKVLSKCMSYKWYVHASKQLGEFADKVRQAGTQHNHQIGGMRGTFFDFIGANRIGKTEAARDIARLCAIWGTGTDVGVVYDYPAGQFAEGLTVHHKVLYFNDMGAGTPDTNNHRAETIIQAVDGRFKPNMAFQSKGHEYEIYAVVASGNYPYSATWSQLRNTVAYESRRIAVYVDWSARFANMNSDAERFEAREQLSQEEKQRRAHLKFSIFPNVQPAGYLQGTSPVPDGTISMDWGALQELVLDELTRNAHRAKEFTVPTDDLHAIVNRHREQNRLPARLEVVVPELAPADKPKYELLKKIGIAAGAIAGAAAIAGLVALAVSYNKKSSFEKNSEGGRYKTRANKRSLNLRTFEKNSNVNDDLTKERIARQTVIISRPDADTRMFGIMIDGQHLLTTAHFFCDDFGNPIYNIEFELEAVYGNDGETLVRLDSFEADRVVHFKNDLCVFKLYDRVPGMRKLRGLIAGDYKKPTKVMRYGWNMFEVTNAFTMIDITYAGAANRETIKCVAYETSASTGDCGQPIMAVIDGQIKLLGIHNAGNRVQKDRGTFLVIPKFDFDEVASVPVPVYAPHNGRGKTVPVGNYATLGVAPVPIFAPMNTALKKTAMWTEACGVDVSAKDFCTLLAMEEKFGVPHPLPPKKVRDFAIRTAVAAFGVHSEVPLRRLTREEVFKSIDWSKSGGYGWPDRKKCRNAEGTDFTDEFWHRVEYVIEQASTWDLQPCIVTPTLKDECRKIEKVLNKQTRTFEIIPFDYLCAHLVVVGAFHEHLLATMGQTPSMMGINVDSFRWHEEWSKFFSGKDDDYYTFDGDFSAWDGNVANWLGVMYRDVLRSLYNNHDPARDCLEYIMMHSQMIIGRTIYLRGQGNPSGRVGTTDINSVAQIMLLACAIKQINPDLTVTDVLNGIRLAVYGDDNVTRAAKNLGITFNAIADQLKRMGWTFTRGDKSIGGSDSMLRKDITFLKRHMLWSSEYQMLVPYVHYKTIIDQLAFCRSTDIDIVEGMIISVMRTYVWRGNRIVTDDEIPSSEPPFDEVAQFVRDCGYQCPTYRQMKAAMFEDDHYQHHNPKRVQFAFPAKDFPELPKDYFEKPTEWIKNGNISTKVDSSQNTYTIYSEGPTAVGNKRDTNDQKAEATVSGKGNASKGGNGPVIEEVDDKPTNWFASMPVTGGPLLNPGFDGKTVGVWLADQVCKSIGPTIYEFATMEEEMVIENLIARPSAILSYTLDLTLPGATFIGAIPMTPFINLTSYGSTTPTIGNSTFMTPLEFVATFFRRWRGHLHYRVKFVAPRFFTGKIVFVLAYGDFTPPSTPPALSSSGQTTSIHFDFDDTRREIDIEVPYIAPTQWLEPSYNHPANASATGAGGNTPQTSMGTIWIYYGTKITSPSQCYTSGPVIQIWLSGSDFCFNDAGSPMGLVPTYLVPSMAAKHQTVLDAELAEEKKKRDQRTHVLKTFKSTMEMLYAKNSGSSGMTVQSVRRVRRVDVNRPVAPIHEVKPIELTELAMKWTPPIALSLSSSSTGAIFTGNVPDDFVNQNAGYVVASSEYFRGNLLIRVAPKGNVNFGGQLLLFFAPFQDKATVTAGGYGLPGVSSLPYALVDLSAATPVVFRIPYRHYNEYYSSQGIPNIAALAGSVHLIKSVPIMVPLDSTCGTSCDIEISYAWEKMEMVVPAQNEPALAAHAWFATSGKSLVPSGRTWNNSHADLSLLDAPPRTRDHKNRGPASNAMVERMAGAVLNAMHEDGRTPVQKHGDTASANTAVQGTESDNPARADIDSSDTTDETTGAQTITSAETVAQTENAITVVNYLPVISTPQDLRELCKRSQPWHAASGTLAADSLYVTPLFNPTGKSMFYGIGGVPTFTVMNKIAACFVGYVGDICFDVDIRSGANMRAWIINVPICSAPAIITNPNVLRTMLPFPGSTTYPWLSAFGVTPPTTVPGTVADVPLASLSCPGFSRAVIPFRTTKKYLTANEQTTSNPAKLPDFVPFFVIYSNAGGAYDFTVYQSIGDNAKFGIYRGIPAMYIGGMYTPGSPPTLGQAPDAFFIVPSMKK